MFLLSGKDSSSDQIVLGSDFSFANQSLIQRVFVSPKEKVFITGDKSGTLRI